MKTREQEEIDNGIASVDITHHICPIRTGGWSNEIKTMNEKPFESYTYVPKSEIEGYKKTVTNQKEIIQFLLIVLAVVTIAALLF